MNRSGHIPFSLETRSSLPATSKRFWIISSTYEILTMKTSARISVAVWSSKAFGFIRGVQCTTTLFCGRISCPRTPDYCHIMLFYWQKEGTICTGINNGRLWTKEEIQERNAGDSSTMKLYEVARCVFLIKQQT